MTACANRRSIQGAILGFMRLKCLSVKYRDNEVMYLLVKAAGRYDGIYSPTEIGYLSVTTN